MVPEPLPSIYSKSNCNLVAGDKLVYMNTDKTSRRVQIGSFCFAFAAVLLFFGAFFGFRLEILIYPQAIFGILVAAAFYGTLTSAVCVFILAATRFLLSFSKRQAPSTQITRSHGFGPFFVWAGVAALILLCSSVFRAFLPK